MMCFNGQNSWRWKKEEKVKNKSKMSVSSKIFIPCANKREKFSLLLFFSFLFFLSTQNKKCIIFSCLFSLFCVLCTRSLGELEKRRDEKKEEADGIPSEEWEWQGTRLKMEEGVKSFCFTLYLLFFYLLSISPFPNSTLINLFLFFSFW